ncbi:MAG: copper oxidase [Acidobacteria bacterium]|nr:copper oxidase [Acidobacteriota bacterium]
MMEQKNGRPRLPKLVSGTITLIALLTLWSGIAPAQTGVTVNPPPPQPTPAPAAPPAASCGRTVTADVVAIDQIYFYNRFGSFDPGGMIYALKRDIVPINPQDSIKPGNAQLRPDKRPRPLVLRANEGDCLKVTFTNLLEPTGNPNGPYANQPAVQPYHIEAQRDSGGQPMVDANGDIIPVTDANGNPVHTPVRLRSGDTPATRTAGVHVNGLDYVGSIASDGAFVGNNPSSLAQPGETKIYTLQANKQGQYLFFSPAAHSGGEGDGGQPDHGLFGSINVEPKNSQWFRSQVTAQVLQAAQKKDPVTGQPLTTPQGHPIINYNAKDAAGNPLLAILSPTNQIIFSDLNAIITDPSGTLQEECNRNPSVNAASAPPSGTCGQPFREFTVIFHDELETGAPAFAELEQEVFSGVRDGFGINYGSSGLGAEVIANRKGIGPAANCVECSYEEFFLESWSNGDPAVLVNVDPSTGKGTRAFFPDDPANVHHSYIGDPVRFRNIHAGPKETHVFHLHQHQWLQSPRDDNSTYLDSQTISPGAAFTYEIQYGGGGNRNVGSPGDSIFHCHLYPHFAQGMWELWRNHDVFEAGTADRNVPDGEIAGGIPQPALVPIPFLFHKNEAGAIIAPAGLPPMPTPDFRGFPFYMAARAGHRAPQPPLALEKNGGLPRHRIEGGTRITGEAAVPADQRNDPVAQRVHDRANQNFKKWTFFFAVELEEAQITLLPDAGTPEEQRAIRFHAGQDVERNPKTFKTQYDWNAIAYDSFSATGAPAQFLVNGRPQQPGAPYADPCPDTFVDDHGTRRPVPLRPYRTAWVQLNMTVNKAGWHDRQARIAVLEDDVAPTLTGTRPTEPLFFRANSGDCIDYRVTNLTRKDLNLDDFQIFQGTDIIGQHIHLVKFDVTSSDGAGNGYNYESGGFAADAVRERIAANNAFQTRTGGTQILTAVKNPKFEQLDPTGNGFAGAQTLIERWWADPLINNGRRDRTLRTVFTHDHFSPSGHQHHGLYAGLVIEPTDSQWTTQNGVVMYTRPDGGPTSYSARILNPNGDPTQSFREFMLEIADFAIVYTPEPANIPVNPPNFKEFPLPIAIGNPVLLDPSQDPHPESISAGDPGTQLINYRNEPLPLRIGVPDPAKPGSLMQAPGTAGDLAFAFDSHVHGDPATPLLTAYPGDRIQVRALQGAQEEQHVLNVHGHKWFFEPGTPHDSTAINNSGYTNSQYIGISEHFEFDMSEKTLPLFSDKNTADYLYQSAATDNLWDGMWGLLRTFATIQPDVAPLPNNPTPAASIPITPFKNGQCPPPSTGVPTRTFKVEARLASSLVGPQGIVYNDRFGFHDPAGIVFIETKDAPSIKAGKQRLEPLVLRANAGDCIQAFLTNSLPAAVPEYDSWNEVPPIIPAFNFNQIKTSNRVSLHPQLLAYDVGSSDGATIGFNNDQTVGPGETKVYTWYAGNVSNVTPNSVTLSPVEFGATNLRDYGDVIKHSSHGLIGSLIIEPAGATWTEDAGTKASATIFNGLSGSQQQVLFREFVVNYQSDVTMQNAQNVAMMNDRGGDDSEDTGMHGFNYRNEPLWARLGFPPETDLNVLRAQDYTNTLSSTAPNPGCGGPCGDPKTPLFTAKAGTPVRFRILDSQDHPRQHGFTVFGHHWQFEPWTANSRALGDNPKTFEVGSYNGIGPTRHLNILINSAGGVNRIPGDYLYRTQESFKFGGGLWGLFRVTP